MATLPADIVAASRRRLSVADFHRMRDAGILGPDDRVELIAGEIIDMSPIGSLHAVDGGKPQAATGEAFSPSCRRLPHCLFHPSPTRQRGNGALRTFTKNI
jgi:hypothetical protein